jgi:hypothetical protein
LLVPLVNGKNNMCTLLIVDLLRIHGFGF